MGNLESSTNEKYAINSDSLPYKVGLWSINKGSFNNTYKNVNIQSNNTKDKLDYEFSNQHIKCLRRLRHPNILKYLYSETTQSSLSCILITEPSIPLINVLNGLKYDELISGLYGITCAIDFLHSKAFISHNNINENSLCLNSKLSWKLSSFEYSIEFNDLTISSFNRIKENKSKFCILPEESDQQLLSTIFSSTRYYHTIDAYCWALMICNLINKHEFNLNNIMHDYETFKCFLDADPTRRPNLEQGLQLSIFTKSENKQESILIDKNNLLKYTDDDPNLDRYLNDLIDFLNESIFNDSITEATVDFLLSPYMFFLSKARQDILPFVLIPSNNTHKIQRNRDKCLKNSILNDDKYKTYVLPRVLNLFSLRILQIRLVLLEYFKYYICFINNQDILKYELLPELLLGLKDENDELVSQTFLCLAIMVKLVGHEIVIGKSKNPNKKYFSNNLPKLTKEDNLKMINKSNLSDDIESIYELREKLSNTTDSMIALNEFQINDDSTWNTNSNDYDLDASIQIHKSEKLKKSTLLTQQSSFKSITTQDNFIEQLDIKNIKIKSKEDDDYFADMQPIIKNNEKALNDDSNFKQTIENGWDDDFDFDD